MIVKALQGGTGKLSGASKSDSDVDSGHPPVGSVDSDGACSEDIPFQLVAREDPAKSTVEP